MNDIQSIETGQEKTPNKCALWKILFICIVSTIGNMLLSYFVSGIAKIPLYLDTVFTTAVCFSLGLGPGLFTGVVLGPLFSLISHKYFYKYPMQTAWTTIIFSLCIAVEILVVCFYIKRIKSRETIFLEKPSLNSFIGLAPFLLSLAALDCIAISLTGGIIDFTLTLIHTPRIYSPEDTFKLGLLRNNIPLLAAAIFSRIPINIVDRFIVIFGGFGISLLYRKHLMS